MSLLKKTPNVSIKEDSFMIESPYYVKHYKSASKRFLQASIESLFKQEFPKTFGPVICERIAEKIVELINKQMPHKNYLRPGQCVWNAVSISTRPDNPNCKLVPVILTLVDSKDIENLTHGMPVYKIAQKAIARITREAYKQNALLSMRDISLLVWHSPKYISDLRKAWEKENDKILPHVGSLQDFGSSVTHKEHIIKKVVYEKKDPTRVANETKHSMKAVDSYLKDFHRVKTCFGHNQEIEFVAFTTGLSKHLVKQYVNIINKYDKINSAQPQ